MVDSHVGLAGFQGFLTNLGGVVTMAVTVPANISGLALLQCHMVAGIAHLRGYDLARPAGPQRRDGVHARRGQRQGAGEAQEAPEQPDGASPPRRRTTPISTTGSPAEVAAELIARVAGKRTIAFIARKIPVIGGGVGAVTDGLATYQVGRYAAKELKRPDS